MQRDYAFELVKRHVKNKNLIKHLLASEAVMRTLASYFDEDPETWGIAGLVHDIDYDLTQDNFAKHGKLGAEILSKEDMGEDIIHAVISHSGNEEPKSTMAKALYAVDPLTGLIVACALITPSKKLYSIDNTFILNRFREKRFAAGANRAAILTCKEIGLSLEQFIETGLQAMQGIHKELGL